MWFIIGIITGLVLGELVLSQFLMNDEDKDEEDDE